MGDHRGCREPPCPRLVAKDRTRAIWRGHRADPLSAGTVQPLSGRADPLELMRAHIAETLTNMGLRSNRGLAAWNLLRPARLFARGGGGAVAIHPFHRPGYMRIDTDIDERMDPFRSTIAAAQFLKFNYDMLGPGRWR